jgi:hypothetical protein
MGCSNSKPVTAVDPTATSNGKGEATPKTSSNVENNLLSDVPPKAALQPAKIVFGTAASPKMAPNGAKGSDDVHWNRLWEAHRTLMLDPADIHSTIEDLMGRATNKLSPAELAFIQRKVRKVIRKNGNQDAKKANLFGKSSSTSALDQENRVIADRYQLLTNNAIQQILPTITLAEASSVNPVTAIFVLLIYSHESLWDRVADIAVQSAKSVGFNMDVNALQPPSRCPSIPRATTKDPIELPLGVSLQSLTFLMGLALRKFQRSRLSFYVLYPPHADHIHFLTALNRRNTDTKAAAVVLSHASGQDPCCFPCTTSSRWCSTVVAGSWQSVDTESRITFTLL